jgi:hypothetical protein
MDVRMRRQRPPMNRALRVGAGAALLISRTLGAGASTPDRGTSGAAVMTRVAFWMADTVASGVHAPQTLAIAQDDLAGAGKSQHALAMELRKRP